MPALNLFGLLIPILQIVGGYFVGRWNERRTNKIDLILKFYRPLIDEFQDALDVYDVFDRLLEGTFDKSTRIYFSDLFKSKSSTLQIVQNIDPDLVEPMRVIFEDLIPALEVINDRRFSKQQEMQNIWTSVYSHILEKREGPDGITKQKLDKGNFVSIVCSNTKFDLWTKDYKTAKKNFLESVGYTNTNVATANVIPHDLSSIFWNKFMDAFEEEMAPIRKDMITKGTLLKNTVTTILSIMNKRIGTIGK